MSEQTAEIVDEPQSTDIIQATPMSLLQLAIDKGFDAERIGQFMDLQDRMEAKRSEQEYVEAMNRCQKRMPVVVRDAENQQTRSRYARLETVSAAIRPIYTEEGFTLEFGEGKSDLPNHRRIVCEVRHVGGCSKPFFLDSPIDDVGAKGSANKTAVQGLGSMISYLRRYLTLMVFNITIADEDTDGNPAKCTISEDAISTLNDMLAQCRAVGNPVEGKRLVAFLKTVGVDEGGTIGDITQAKFLTAVGLLTKCISSAAKKAEVAS